jgi:NitT/TauT family transport system substrate-binding protein
MTASSEARFIAQARSSFRRRTGFATMAALTALTVAVGCGSPSNPSSSSGPEKTHLVVGVLPIPDSAALYIAIKRGFFKQVGLTVTPKILSGGAVVNQDLLAGTTDVGQGNYVSDMEAEANGGQWKVLAPATAAAPNAFQLLVAKNSKITSPGQMAGATVGTPALKGIGPLLASAALEPYGVKPNELKFAIVPFPEMTAALSSGHVQAIETPDPWISAAEKAIGARTVLDLTGQGMATAGLPVGGWAATASWVTKYPKTAAAFTRAIVEGQQVAATQRSAVEQILPSYTAITPAVASVITLQAFPTSITAPQLQRVTAIMIHLGYIPASDSGPAFVQKMLVSKS